MNIAKVIQFPQQQASQPSTEARKSMYSDKFQQGYVMSSLLYRKEVYPFLSDAARNVYAELENRINGYNKESDFVSYSQLQGGDLPGARQLSRETVRNGLKELIKLSVVEVIASGKRGLKSYKINEVSIKDQFDNQTSSIIKLVRKKNQNQSTSKTSTGSETEHTIDNPLDNLDIKKEKPFSVDNFDSDIFSNSIEYHCEDQNLYTFRELANVYTIKSDFTAQAKNLNSELTDDQILADLKNFAQWSTTREKTTAQGWMNYWIYRIQNLSTPKSKAESKPKSAPGTKKLSDSQRHMFANKLSVLPEMNKYSQGTESYQQFAVRIAQMLQDPNKFKELSGQLRSVGFVGSLEDFA